MIISEIYLWGAAIVACLLVVASVALALLDGKMLRHMFAIYGATVAQMVVVTFVADILGGVIVLLLLPKGN